MNTTLVQNSTLISVPLQKEQNENHSFRETAIKISYYIGSFLLVLGALLIAASIVIGPIGLMGAPIFGSAIGILKAMGIGVAAGIPSAIIGGQLIRPQFQFDWEKKLEREKLVDLTKVIDIGGVEGGVSNGIMLNWHYNGPKEFCWHEVVRYYGGSPSKNLPFETYEHGRRARVRAGVKTFKDLEKRIQKEIQTSPQPLQDARILCESLAFDVKRNYLSRADADQIHSFIRAGEEIVIPYQL